MVNNWKISAIAGLDGTQSRNQLNSDIKGLSRNLDKLKLYAEIDKNQVTQLQNQLKHLQVQLNNITVSDAVINGLVAKINAGLQNVNIGNINIGNASKQTEQLGKEIGSAITNGMKQNIDSGVVTEIKKISDATTSTVVQNEEKKQQAIQETANKFDKISKDTSLVRDDARFQQVFGTSAQEAQKAQTHFKKLLEEEKAVVTVTEKFDDSNMLQSFIVDIQRANGEIETLRYSMEDLSQYTGKENDWHLAYQGGSVSDSKVEKQLEQHIKKANDLQTKLDKIQAGYSDTNASRPIKDSGNISALYQQYDKVAQAIENVRNADNSTFSSMVSNAQKEITTLETMVTQFRNAENVATQMKSVDISSGIAQAQERLGKLKADASGFEQMTETVRKLDIAIEGVGDKSSLDAFINDLRTAETQLGRVKAEEKQLKEFNKIQLSTDLTKLETDYKKLGVVSQEVEINLKELKLAHESVLNAKGTDKLGAEIDKYNIALDKAKSSVKELTTTQVSMSQRTSQMTHMQEWMRKNQKATKLCGDEVEKLIQECKTCDKVRFNQIKNEFKGLQVAAGEAGKLGNTLWGGIVEQGTKFLQWTGITTSIMAVSNNIREAVSELKNLDDILTEISKTSDLTEKQLKELGNTAFESASKYGKTASEYLTGVQEMYRAGFDNASEMAELSLLAQAAGDMEANSANDYLIATNAAYDYKNSVEELNKVLDAQNYITNNSALSLQDMADATSEAGSIAAQYGVQINELSALIAVAVSKTRESGSEVGTTLKSLFVNLQDTTSKPIRAAFDAVGISMTKIVDGAEQLKTPVELIKELSVVFNQLPDGDIKKANILNDIAGKYNANTFAAILSDLESYSNMLELYTQGSGSAAKEAEKSANNWSGSLKKISNSWSDLVQNFAESDTIISALNVLNDFIVGIDKLTEKIGALGTIGIGAGLFAGIKNVGINMLVAC